MTLLLQSDSDERLESLLRAHSGSGRWRNSAVLRARVAFALVRRWSCVGVPILVVGDLQNRMLAKRYSEVPGAMPSIRLEVVLHPGMWVRNEAWCEFIAFEVERVANNQVVSFDTNDVTYGIDPGIVNGVTRWNDRTIRVCWPVVPSVRANGVGAKYIFRSRTRRSPYEPNPRKLLFLWT